MKKNDLTNGEIYTIMIVLILFSLVGGKYKYSGIIVTVIYYGIILYDRHKQKKQKKIDRDFYFSMRGYDEQGQPYHSKYGFFEDRWQEIQEKISKGEPWK